MAGFFVAPSVGGYRRLKSGGEIPQVGDVDALWGRRRHDCNPPGAALESGRNVDRGNE